MSVVSVPEASADWSPVRIARTAGALYLGVFVAGVLSLVTRSSVTLSGVAAATAANFLASESVYWSSVVTVLIAAGCYFGVSAFLYDLLRPVSRTVSLLA